MRSSLTICERFVKKSLIQVQMEIKKPEWSSLLVRMSGRMVL